jgi:hypothetical protein
MGRLLSPLLIILLSVYCVSRSFGKSNSDSMLFRQVRRFRCLSLADREGASSSAPYSTVSRPRASLFPFLTLLSHQLPLPSHDFICES